MSISEAILLVDRFAKNIEVDEIELKKALATVSRFSQAYLDLEDDRGSTRWLPYVHGVSKLKVGSYLFTDGRVVEKGSVEYYPSDDEYEVFLPELSRIDGAKSLKYYSIITLPQEIKG